MTHRLYYDDSKLRSFSAVVTDVRERVRANGQSLWEIALDQSAFYPTSGGQPFDTGHLRAVSRGGATLEAAVIDVTEDDDGEVWHCTSKPLNAGTVVTGEIDWPRRRDHMQQHSGQHLLSAVFARQLNAPTVSFHLGEESSSIDIALDSIDLLEATSVARIESIANDIITEDRTVSLRTVSREQAELLLAQGSLRKLPPRVGDIRMVEIDALDLNACGGTHVQSTGEIGALLLRRIEKVRGGVRVEFYCGARAVQSSRNEYAHLTEAAGLLSSSAAQLPAAVQKLLAEAKSAERERWSLLEQLAEFQAAELLRSPQELAGVPWIYHELPQHDLESLKLLAAKLTTAANCAALLVGTQTGSASVVLARSAELLSGAFNSGEVLRQALAALGARGGGSATLAQGAVALEQTAELRRLVEASITGKTG